MTAENSYQLHAIVPFSFIFEDVFIGNLVVVKVRRDFHSKSRHYLNFEVITMHQHARVIHG